MKEIIGEYQGMYSYQIKKEVTNDYISISPWKIKDDLEIWCCDIKFRNVGEQYKSEFLSWYNLLFCSNNYGCAPDYDYMTNAVQQNLKTAATVYYSQDSGEGQEIIKNLPNCCRYVPLGENMIFIYHKGSLSDYFDIDIIKEYYEKHGIDNLDWNEIKNYANMPMKYFASDKCNINIQASGKKEHTVIVGLLFGYPIESTISSFSNMITIAPPNYSKRK